MWEGGPQGLQNQVLVPPWGKGSTAVNHASSVSSWSGASGAQMQDIQGGGQSSVTEAVT